MAEQDSKSERRISKTERRYTTSFIELRSVIRKNGPPSYSWRHPALVIKGNWLREAGFDIGTRFTIKVNDGCLVLIADSLEEKRQDERLKQMEQSQAAMDLKQAEMDQTIQKVKKLRCRV